MRNLERHIALVKSALDREQDNKRLYELLALLSILKDERIEQLSKDYVKRQLTNKYKKGA